MGQHTRDPWSTFGQELCRRLLALIGYDIMNNLTLSKKLMLGALANILLVCLLTASCFWTLSTLRDMQNTGADAALKATDSTNLAAHDADSYRIIADAEINRDLNATARDWAEEKAAVAEELKLAGKKPGRRQTAQGLRKRKGGLRQADVRL